MGYCCHCIPLTVYGVIYGCVQIISSFYYLIDIGLFSDPEQSQVFVVLKIVIESIYVIAATYLIIGSLKRRHQYITAFLIIIGINICWLFVGVCIGLILLPTLFAFFFVQLLVTCLLAFPICLLYDELYEEPVFTI